MLSINKRNRLCAVEPLDVDAAQWQKLPLQLQFKDNDVLVSYSGMVLRSVRAPIHLLEFGIESNPLMTSAFSIALLATHPATVTFFAGEQTLATFPVCGSRKGAQRLCRMTVDLTTAIEKSNPLRLRVKISFGDASGQVSMPLDTASSGEHPTLVQTWAAPYSVIATAYFTCAWVAAQAVLLIIAAHLPTNQLSRDISMLSIALGWFAGLAGVPDLARVPVKACLRRTWGRLAAPHRHFIVPLISLLVAGLLFWEWSILRCVMTRIEYTSLVTADDKGDQYEEMLIRALILVPDRREAQWLICNRLWGLRPTDPVRKRFINALIHNAVLMRTLEEYPSEGYRSRSLASDYVVSKPYIWLASILPEADSPVSSVGSSNSLRMLQNRVDFDSILLRSLVQIPLLQRQWDDSADTNATPTAVTIASNAYAMVKAELTRATAYNQFSVWDPQFIQEAFDILAQDAFREGNYTQSLDFYRKVLELRRHREATLTPSLRPPQKLSLYHLLGGLPDTNANQYLSVPEFAAGLSGEWSSAYSRSNRDRESKWREGTILVSTWAPQSKAINESLEKGWRY